MQTDTLQKSEQNAEQNTGEISRQSAFLIPYQTLRAKTVSKQVIYNFWKQFQEDKLNSILFYDGEMQDYSAFAAWLSAKDKDARFIASDQGEIKALYWLNNPLGKSVMIHFCFLKSAFCEQKEIGLYVVKSLLFCKDKQGGYVISALYGLTPKPYHHALSFIQKLGFSFVGELPEACYFARKNAFKTGIFSILTREQIPTP